MPIVAGATPATAHDTRRANGRKPSSAAFSGMRDDAHRRRIVLTARVAGGDCGVWIGAPHQRAQGAEPLERGVGTRVLVAVDHCVSPATLDGDRDDLLGEHTALLGGERPLVRAQRELVLVKTRDGVLPAHVLRCLDHASGYRMVDTSGRYPRPRETIVQRDAATLDTPTHSRRVELDLAHAVGATREHQIGHPRLDLHAGKHDRL